MSIALADRPPSRGELEKLRLILSTYPDGTGMLNIGGRNLPGWWDFERAVALAFGGEAQESKAIFDVILVDRTTGVRIGISCKMRDTLRETQRTGQATIEVSNSAGYFWTRLRQHGLAEQNYHTAPGEVGFTVVHLIGEWHESASTGSANAFDLTRSCYLALQWDHQSGDYQLFRFPLKLPAPDLLRWEVSGKRLVGWQGAEKAFEWYGLSGGQLKYYPSLSTATWRSEVFQLEPLPDSGNGYGLIRKTAELFPRQWERACQEA
jgi:hypothetical protein